MASSSKLLDSELLLNKLDGHIEFKDNNNEVTLVNDLNLNIYNLLLGEINNEQSNGTSDVDVVKAKIRFFLNFKLNFLNNELSYVTNNIEANDSLGLNVNKLNVYFFMTNKTID